MSNFPGAPQQRNRQAALDNSTDQGAQQTDIVGGIGSFFGGVANFFAAENNRGLGGNNEAIPQVEEQTESYLPSLDFKRKLEGKSVLLTGATGAVGSAVARKLLKCNLKKLVLFVRDRDNLDPKIE